MLQFTGPKADVLWGAPSDEKVGLEWPAFVPSISSQPRALLADNYGVGWFMRGVWSLRCRLLDRAALFHDMTVPRLDTATRSLVLGYSPPGEVNHVLCLLVRGSFYGARVRRRS